jgi:IstB-like ATP binding protein
VSASSAAPWPATAPCDLLCLDELGYLHLDSRGAELLFQVLTEREEKASVAAASNAPFSEWGQTFTDPRLAAAIVDRLTFNALIIETGSQSYRLRATRSARKVGLPRFDGQGWWLGQATWARVSLRVAVSNSWGVM